MTVAEPTDERAPARTAAARVEDLTKVYGSGDTRVVAYVGAQFTGEQISTLQRCRVERALLCGDPDGGGDTGTLRNVVALANAGITPLVVPRLPEGQDPDDYALANGIDAWRARVAEASHDYRQ